MVINPKISPASGLSVTKLLHNFSGVLPRHFIGQFLQWTSIIGLIATSVATAFVVLKLRRQP